MMFNDFVHKFGSKKKATSNIKFYEVLKKIGLDSKVGIYLRDEDFSTNYGTVNLHPSKGSHCDCYINEKYFESFGSVPPQNLPKFNKKRNGLRLYSGYKIQGLTTKRDSFCASFCL